MLGPLVAALALLLWVLRSVRISGNAHTPLAALTVGVCAVLRSTRIASTFVRLLGQCAKNSAQSLEEQRAGI